MEPRSHHGGGIVTDVVTDEQLVVVTGGWSCDVLASTEILQDGEWVQGKTNKSILHISHCLKIIDIFINLSQNHVINFRVPLLIQKQTTGIPCLAQFCLEQRILSRHIHTLKLFYLQDNCFQYHYIGIQW